jgi:GlpG protein
MRLIGHLTDEISARAFADYLYVQGIENQLEQDNREGWGIWISDEDKITRASDLLTAYRQNPSDPKYAKEGKGAAELRAQEEKDQDSYRKKLRNRRHLFQTLTPYSFGPLTFGMIAVSVFVAFLSNLGGNKDAIRGLFITDFTSGVWDPSLPEIRQGEIWRLITPIFIHFGLPHIVFNMFCLRDFGSMIEARQSSLHLLILTIVFAICSNLGEVYIGHALNFGGMSGVLYGLLGYIWIRGKFDPGSGLYLHPYTVIIMIGWFFACYTGFLGPVANTAHAVGLGMGMAWGFLSSLPYRRG